MSVMYQKYLDPVVEEFTTGQYYRQVYEAKKEYFEKAGEVHEDDIEFEQRMTIFMDWYIFDRDLPNIDLSPMKYFFRQNKSRFRSDEITIYKDLCSTVHSLFRLRRRTWNKKALIVEDLFSKTRYRVATPEISRGFSRGDIFEARLIPFSGRYEFSRGFCFHPPEMGGFILKEIKKVRFQDQGKQTKLILSLSNMKLNHLRYQHIDVRHFYTFDSRF